MFTMGVLLLSAIASAPDKSEPTTRLGYPDLVAYMFDLETLPAIEPGVRCLQFSSYDRASRYDEATGEYIDWDANADAGNFLHIDESTGEAVMAEMDGPGCIYRIWSANPEGLIRFYLDGDERPTYEFDFHELCTGRIDPFIKPLVWKRDPKNAKSASNIYVPISFNTSCKVTGIVKEHDGTTRAPAHYYIINYRTFPKDWEVETFNLPLSSVNRLAIERAATLWRDGLPDEPYETMTFETKPFQAWTYQEFIGQGVVTSFHAKVRSDEPWIGRRILLRVYFDGEPEPSIDSPISDFFGEPKDVPYRSYPMQIAEKMNTCRFPMPFRKSMRIEMVGETKEPVKVDLGFSFQRREIPDNWGHFHAKWRGEIASRNFDYPLIVTYGTGKLVGIALFVDNIAGGWWGEGDEKVYLDGEKFPSWFGTGTEDYFGDAWGIQHFVNPSHGHPQKKVERMQGCYRWHLGDNIPYSKSLIMTIENYTGVPEAVQHNDYSSMAYWYELPGGRDFFNATQVEDRIPRGYVAPGAVEVERYLKPAELRTGMAILFDDDLPEELSNRRGLGLEGSVGSTFTFNLPADSTDAYEVKVVAARGTPASSYEFVDDNGEPIERLSLRRGLNPVTIRFTGEPVADDKCGMIIDYVLMNVYRRMITDWRFIGPFPVGEDEGLETPFGPERDGFDAGAEYHGQDNQPLRWRPVSKQDGLVLLNDQLEPKDHCVVYGACVVTSPDDRIATMLVGSDDGIKVWVNGAVVFARKAERPLAYDSDRFGVELREGPNDILIKVKQRLGDVGFCARFIDAKDELTFGIPELWTTGDRATRLRGPARGGPPIPRPSVCRGWSLPRDASHQAA